MSKRARLKAEMEAEQSNKRINRRKLIIGIVSCLLLLSFFAGVMAQFNMLPTTSANFFSPDPVPSPTPTPVVLSKEYIYAGSRMLAVEEPNAPHEAATDLAVFRQSDGSWWILNALTGGTSGNYWGMAGDKAIPADFDGDSKADVAIWRPSTGVWYIIRSSDGAGQYATLGVTGDIPVPADYDGDGKADVAVYRPSVSSYWYILRSSDNQVVYQQYGSTNDEAAQGDYDGDGRADIAVYRPSTSEFFILQTTSNQSRVESFGTTGSKPVQGDYDGDGKFDLALRNGNIWNIKDSSTGVVRTPFTWEQSGDIAVQGDYDADGKTDIAVWRNSNGTWYIKKSGDGTTRTTQWGASGDTPVPAPFRR